MGTRRPPAQRRSVGCVASHLRGVRDRGPVQVLDQLRRRSSSGGEGRPVRSGRPARPGDGVDRGGAGPRVGRWRVDGRSWLASPTRRTDLDLRGAPRIMAVRARRVHGSRTATRRLLRRHGVHARRTAPDHGASVLWVVGVSDDGLLRSHRSLRPTRGRDGARRHAASSWHRRDPRLGTVALPDRRGVTRLLRRNPSVRARRSEAGFPSRLEVVRVQLRPSRSSVVPVVVGALLARSVPCRRSTRRCRGVDALSRLLARRRRVGRERARRQREPRSRRLPARAQHVDLRVVPRRGDDRRGVHRVARRDESGRHRWPRFRVQVGHGLDARHARVPVERPGPSPMAP